MSSHGGDIPPAELRRTARTIGGSLRAAARGIKVMQNGLLMLAEIRAGGSRGAAGRAARGHRANGRLQVIDIQRGIAASAAP